MGRKDMETAGPATKSLQNFISHFCEVFGHPVGDTSVSEQLKSVTSRNNLNYRIWFKSSKPSQLPVGGMSQHTDKDSN